MGVIYAGLTAVLVLWGFSYFLEGLVERVSATLTSLFPAMNPLVALVIAWLPLVFLGLLIFAAVAHLFHRGGEHGS